MPETLAPEPTETAHDFLQRSLDKVAPMPKGSEPTPKEPAAAPVEPAKPTPEPKPTVTEEKPLPSFLESKPDPTPEPKEEPWPEEIPGEKDPKKQADYKKWRTQYETRGEEINRLKTETEELRKKTGSNDPEIQSRIQALEKENTIYKERFDKVYVENSDWFQNSFVKPREQAVNQAKQIIKDVGGDDGALEKVLTLKGKAYWEALDEVSTGLPEAAKLTLTNLVSNIQIGDQKRDEVLSQSKQAAEGLRQHEFQINKQFIEKDITETRSTFQEVVEDMRGKGLEVLQRTTDPKAQWWNTDIVEKIEKGAEETLFKSPDKRRHVAAIILGHAADEYRSLWQKSEERARTAEKKLADIESTAPNLDGGGGGMPAPSGEDDPNKPVGETFIQILEKQRAGK